ncbi:MAG TPA: M23 family metallopeptidase [Thermoanaerobaculia bacterium]|nr:M23 family metallopeptidase [Thermoanaerobaculia bacterium]
MAFQLVRTVASALLLALALDPSTAEGAEAPKGGLSAHGALQGPTRDEIPDSVRRAIAASIAEHERAGRALPAPKADPVYPFYPQAGILGQDLFILNFTDLDTSPNIRDWDCSGYTYDGHRGHDSMIRSFREQAVGVPIFAALDGLVVDSHDGEPDQNTVQADVPANFVILDHGGGFYALYWHMKRGSVAVGPGQTVTAGTQLGLTGSSGFSSGPHLHFESWNDRQWFEPSAGPCRSGASFWRSQPPVARGFYVADAYLARGEISFDSALAYLLDGVARTSTFGAGSQRVSLKMDFRNLPGGSSWRLRVVHPGGATVVDESGSWGNSVLFRGGFGVFWADLSFTPGRWRFLVDVNEATVVDAPFTVAAVSRAVNRKPNPVKARLVPAAPATGEVMTCQVRTSLIFEDPDYDLVRYKYVWKVNNRVVRTVTSAALSDVLAKGKARKGDRVICSVTPSDGRANGPAAVARSGR